MYLTREEERIYEGEAGWTKKKAMEILVAIGDLNDASRLIPIESAHVSGVSYKTIGDAFQFIENLEGRVEVKSTLNPMGMDRERWSEMDIPEEFADRQKRILAAYSNLGISPECTCVPYLLEGYAPGECSHIAWAESSAVLYANSVLGAMTNMEGAPSALASALIGKTPLYGLHLIENRMPKLKVRVNCTPTDADYSALGYLVGQLAGDRIPMIELAANLHPNGDELKHLSAAIGATGAVGMYHVKGVTAEVSGSETEAETDLEEEIELEKRDLDDVYEECGSDDNSDEPEVIAIGCPHCSYSEIRRIYRYLKSERGWRGGTEKVRRDVFIFTARRIKNQLQGLINEIESYGVKVFCDTCYVVSPAFGRYKSVLTNSGKMKRYVPLICNGACATLCSTRECIKAAFR